MKRRAKRASPALRRISARGAFFKRNPTRRAAPGKKRPKPEAFLEALGRHCEKLRKDRGYSIDRMAKESETLSSSVIHRLETGSGAVTVTALYRYAQLLKVEPKELLDFLMPGETASAAAS